MLGEDDAKIREYAVRRGMIVVTKDADFVHLRRSSTHAPRVIWVRLGNATSRALTASIQPQLNEVLAALAAGEEIVEIR